MSGIIPYKISVSLDNKKALSSLADMNTKMTELKDGEVLIDFKYNQNMGDFNKKVKEISKISPELGIQFQYDINKRGLLLAQEQLSKLEEIDLRVNEKGVDKYIDELIAKVKDLYNSGVGEKELINPIQELLNITKTISPDSLARVEVELGEIYEEFEGLSKLKPISLYNMGSKESLKKDIDYFTNAIEKLKKEGAADLVDSSENKDIAELTERVKILEDRVLSLQHGMLSLENNGFLSAADSASVLREQLEAILSLVTQIPQKTMSASNAIVHVGNTSYIGKKDRVRSDNLGRLPELLKAGMGHGSDFFFSSPEAADVASETFGSLTNGFKDLKTYIIDIGHLNSELNQLTFTEENAENAAIQALKSINAFTLKEAVGADKFKELGIDTDSKYGYKVFDTIEDLYNQVKTAIPNMNMTLEDFSFLIRQEAQKLQSMGEIDEKGIFKNQEKYGNEILPSDKLLDKLGYTGFTPIKNGENDGSGVGGWIINPERFISNDESSSEYIKVFSEKQEEEAYNFLNNIEDYYDSINEKSKALLEKGNNLKNQVREIIELTKQIYKSVAGVYKDDTNTSSDSEATTPLQTDQITEAEQSVDDFANGVIEQFSKRTSDMENAAQKAGDSVSEAFNKAVNENKGQTLKDIENAYDSNGKLAQKAGNLKQLREQYNRLRNINHDIEVLENPDNYVTSSNGHKDFVRIGQKKTGLGLDELKALKKEIIELNPQLQELEDRTERIKKSDFEQRFEHTFSDFIDKEIGNSIPEEFYEQYRKIIDEYREGKTSAEEATIAAKNLREEIEKGVPDDKTLISSDDIVDDLEVEIKTAQEATEAIEKKSEAEREAPSAKALSERIYSRIRNKSVDDFSTEEFAKLEQKVNETISEMERFGYNTDKVKARWESFKQSVDEGIDTSKTQQQAEAVTNSELELVDAMDKVDKEKADDSANQVTAQSAKLTAEEAQAMADLFDKALKAAEAKEKFAGANKQVLESIITSLSALNSEGDGFNNLNKIINNLTNNKDDRITNLIKNLTSIRDILSTSINEDAFINALRDIANQGESLKDLATVLKATQSQINKAKQSIKNQSSTNPVSPVQSDQKDVRGTSHNQQYDSQGNVTREVSSFTVRNQSGRNTRYTRTTNSQTGEIQYAIHETTDYNKAIDDTVTAIIRARKVQHELNLEWEKTKPNQDRINALTDELSDYYRVIRQATQAAHDFEQENADWYNDSTTGSKHGQQQHFTDYVRQRATQGIAKEDERYASYISERNEKLIRQVDNDIFTAQFELDNGNHIETFNDKLRDIITNLETIKKTRPDAITEQQVELARKYSDELKQANKEGKLSANNKANENSILKNLGQINELLSGNTKLSFRNTDVYRDLINLQNEFKNFNTSRPQSELKDLTTRFLEVKSRFNELSETFKGDNLFITFIKRLHGTTAQLIAQYLSFQDIVRYIRSMATTIIDLDTQLVDLRKTTTMTTTELERFYSSSSNVAKQLGVTTSEIISQASAWSRLGYSSQEAATKMAKFSSQFASISPGMDTESATDALVSTMQAYKIGVDDVQRTVMDNINAIGNTMATTNAEIGEMLQRSSAAMKAANNTLEETIALESAAVEITRNAETTGTAFRTISMRIRGEQSLPPYSESYVLCA